MYKLNRAFKILGVEDGEKRLVVLLFLLSFFLGLFQISYEISATTLFLTEFDDAMLSKALFISGLLGICLTYIYSRLQNYISFSKLIIFTLLFVALIAVILRFSFAYVNNAWVTFAIFIFMGPLCILSIIAYWGVAGRLFTLRQGKRLFGLVYSGQLFGIILFSLVIRLFPSIVEDIRDFLLIGSSFVFASFILQLFISASNKDKLKNVSGAGEAQEKKVVDLSILYKNSYVLKMAVFVILSVVTAFFIYVSFLSVSKEKYPNSSELAGFFALFIASANIFSFIIRTFVHSKLLKNYGLKVILVLIPSLLGLFTLLAIIVGSVWGYSVNQPTFIFFFIIIALSRLFYLTLKESVQLPTFEIIFQSLNKQIRFVVQAAVDGVVNEFAAISSGLILVAMTFIPSFRLIHYSYITFIITVAWVIIALRLYKAYKISLQDSLAQTKNVADKQNTSGLMPRLMSKLQSDSKTEVLTSLSMIDLVAPAKYNDLLKENMSNPNPEVRTHVVSIIDENLLLDYLPILKKNVKKEPDPEVKNLIEKTISHFEAVLSKTTDTNEIAKLVSSVHPEDRRVAAKLAGFHKTDESAQYLLVLLRDIVGKVRLDAIKSSDKFSKPEIFSILIDNLLNPQYSLAASKAFEIIGEKSIGILEQTFHKSGIEQQYRIRIIKLMSNIGGAKAIEQLTKKLDFPNREIQLAAIQALLRNNYTCKKRYIEIAKRSLLENAAVVAWNLTVYNSLTELLPESELTSSFSDEISRSYSVIYDILSLLYDRKSIRHIRENIESGETDNINYSIELLDLLLDEDLKASIIPLFEDIPLKEKIKVLHDYFPIQEYTLSSLLEDLINRSINYLSRWTKALALVSYKNIANESISDTIIAQLFNPDILLREIAADIIYSVSPDQYEHYLKRIPREYRNSLDAVVKNKKKISRIDYLFALTNTSLKTALSGEDILRIAENSEENRFDLESQLTLNDFGSENALFIIKEGAMVLKNNNIVVREFNTGDILDESILKFNTFAVVITEKTIIYKLNKLYRDQLIYDCHNIVETIIDMNS